MGSKVLKPKDVKQKAVSELKDTPHKVLSFKRIIDASGLNQDKVYNNLKGVYNSLSPSEIDTIVKTMAGPIKSILDRWGYTVKIEKKQADS